MKFCKLIILMFFFTKYSLAQFDFHREKAIMISEITQNISKSFPQTPIILLVDLTYSELQLSSGYAGVHAILRDANAVDTVELRILKESLNDPVKHAKISIEPYSRYDPLVCQRVIDSTLDVAAGNDQRSFIYVQTECPSDGWNKLQFILHDQAFRDTVFSRYLPSKIYVPVHIYFYQNGKEKNMSDEIFTFKLTFPDGNPKSQLISRTKL